MLRVRRWPRPSIYDCKNATSPPLLGGFASVLSTGASFFREIHVSTQVRWLTAHFSGPEMETQSPLLKSCMRANNFGILLCNGHCMHTQPALRCSDRPWRDSSKARTRTRGLGSIAKYEEKVDPEHSHSCQCTTLTYLVTS